MKGKLLDYITQVPAHSFPSSQNRSKEENGVISWLIPLHPLSSPINKVPTNCISLPTLSSFPHTRKQRGVTHGDIGSVDMPGH
jgi:hypothetical protein